MKKAQDGVESPLKSRIAPKKSEFRAGQIKRMDRVFEANPDRGIKVAKRMLKRKDAKDAAGSMMKNGGMKKAKSGKEFGMLSVKAGIDKNPKPTAADRIAGAKKMAKSGSTVSMQLGSYKDIIGKNYKGKNTKAVGLTKAMNGKKMKGGGKCKNGC